MEKKEPALPTNDFVFKKLFGSVGNEKITQNLIESIIERKIGDINLEGNTILEKELVDDKGCVLDVKAKLYDGELCDLEMQISNEHNVEDRMLTYWSKLFLKTLKGGDDYTNSKRTIVIFITKFKLDNMKMFKQCHTKWQKMKRYRKQRRIMIN